MEELEEKMIELPEQDPESKNSTKVQFLINLDKKLTLIFDLDETLVHCEHNEMISYDHIVSINAPSGDIVDVNP